MCVAVARENFTAEVVFDEHQWPVNGNIIIMIGVAVCNSRFNSLTFLRLYNQHRELQGKNYDHIMKGSMLTKLQ
jgi:hypothetical protein